MNDDARMFECPKCHLRIGQIEPDGALLMYPGVRTVRADLVCRCGKAIRWNCHESALDELVNRVIEMRNGTATPMSVLT